MIFDGSESVLERTTIVKIAQIANVSPKTVSKALNDQPGVSEELRTKIKGIAADSRYIPNLFGRGLQGKSTRTIGVIVSNNNTNPAYSEIIKGIESKAEEHDYTIMLCNSNENPVLLDKQIKLLIQKQVDGIILAPVSTGENARRAGVEELKRMNIPFVFINRNIREDGVDCVKTDNISGGYLATRYLLDKGHTKILHMTTNSYSASALDRIQGYKKALEEYDIKFDKKNIYTSEKYSIDGGYETMQRILLKIKDFTAIFAFSDILAYGAIKAIQENKRAIPADIAVIGHDDYEYSSICLVPLTTVHQDLNKIGTMAMDMRMQKIQNKEVKTGEILLDPYIVERLSV